jgi:hypothetical protein
MARLAVVLPLCIVLLATGGAEASRRELKQTTVGVSPVRWATAGARGRGGHFSSAARHR